MVVVAGLGAAAALQTAWTEHEAALLERRFAQARLYEITERQRLLDQGLADAILGNRISHSRLLAEETRGAATRLAENAPVAAAELSLRSQEERAVSRALRPFYDFVLNPFDAKLSVEESLKKRLARTLVRRGFEADWKEPLPPPQGSAAAAQPHSIWHRLDAKLADAHSRMRGLALGVVVFVLSLTFFTASDLAGARPWATRFFVLAIVAAIAAVCWLLSVDASLWWKLALVCATLFALCVFAWRRGREHAHDVSDELVEPGEFEGRWRFAHLPHGSDDPFGLTIVLCVAFTVLCSALAGWLYTDADAESSAALHAAIDQEVEMHTRTTRLGTALNSVLQESADVQEYRARAAAARHRTAFHEAIGAPAAAAIARSLAESYLAAVARKPRVAELLDDSEAGVNTDPLFPKRMISQQPLRRLQNNAWQPFALWDAYSQRSIEWHHKAEMYLAALTIFVIALYLFGQARGMGHGPAPRILVGFAVCLVLAAISMAVYERATPVRVAHAAEAAARCAADEYYGPLPATAEEQAAYHYAVSQRYRASGSADDEKRARDALECVVAMRPDFAVAQAELAGMRASIGSSQAGESYASMLPQAELAAVINARKQALAALRRNHYIEPASHLSSLGFDTLLLAFAQKKRELVGESVDLLKRAVNNTYDGGDAAGSARGLARLNQFLALLAAGRIPEAREALDAAFNSGAAQDKPLIAAELTDLELVLRYCADLHAKETCDAITQEIGKTKEALVKAAWTPDAPPPTGSPRVEGAEVVVSAGSAHWRGELRGARPADQLAIIWYAHDKEWDTWRVLPELSGRVQAEDVSRARTDWARQPYFSRLAFRRCLGGPAGTRYRAEFYVNNRYIDTFHAGSAPAPTKPAVAHDLNVATCIPTDWRMGFTAEASKVGWLLRAVTNARGQPVLVMATFYTPMPAIREANRLEGLKTAMRGLGWIDGSEPFEPYSCDKAYGLPAALVRRWTTSEGFEHIGIGLTRNATARELCAALYAMEERYKPEGPVRR